MNNYCCYRWLKISLVLLCQISFAARAYADIRLKQICVDSIVDGIAWEDRKWKSAVFDQETFIVQDHPLADCFKYDPPSELARLSERADFENAQSEKKDSTFRFFRNHTPECIGKTYLGLEGIDLFSCIRSERVSDRRISYDCRGTGWNLLFLTPNEGFHYSRITGATGAEVPDKPPMFVSAGKCSAFK